jgi:hypothetical protein
MAGERSLLSREGTVARLRLDQEGATNIVMRFVLNQDDGESRPVEMRGEQLRGVINAGDRVAVSEERSVGEAQDATLRPSSIRNLSTSGVVEMWRPRRSARVIRAIGLGEVRSSAISAAVGGVIAVAIGSVFTEDGAQAPPPGELPSGSSEPSIVGLLVVLSIVFVFASVVWLSVRRITSRRLPKWSVVIGLAVGLIAIGIPLALALSS